MREKRSENKINEAKGKRKEERAKNKMSKRREGNWSQEQDKEANNQGEGSEISRKAF